METIQKPKRITTVAELEADLTTGWAEEDRDTLRWAEKELGYIPPKKKNAERVCRHRRVLIEAGIGFYRMSDIIAYKAAMAVPPKKRWFRRREAAPKWDCVEFGNFTNEVPLWVLRDIKAVKAVLPEATFHVDELVSSDEMARRIRLRDPIVYAKVKCGRKKVEFGSMGFFSSQAELQALFGGDGMTDNHDWIPIAIWDEPGFHGKKM